MMSPHLPEDRFTEIAMSGAPSAAEEAHVAWCAECQERRRSVSALLDEIACAAALDADSAFPDHRLTRMRARILRLVDRDARPARVIAFPASSRWNTPFSRPRPLARWVALAAASGLVVGLVTDQIVSQFRGQPLSPQRTVVSDAPSLSAARPVSGAAPASDDEFLSEVEAAVLSAGPAALRPLDQMTPRAWDIAR